jgi:hypothetical protein
MSCPKFLILAQEGFLEADKKCCRLTPEQADKANAQ